MSVKINPKLAAIYPTRADKGLAPIKGSKACKCGRTISANKPSCFKCLTEAAK